MGDVTSLEIAIPEGAKSVRIAYTMGDEGGYSEDQIPLLWRASQPTGKTVLHLLILAPGRSYTHECSGEPIDVLITYPNGTQTGGSMCMPLQAGSEHPAAGRKHELPLTGPTPTLEEWMPIYLRAWAPVEIGASGSGERFDLAAAFTIQVMFSAAEFEQMGTEPPLNAQALMQIPEISWSANPGAPRTQER